MFDGIFVQLNVRLQNDRVLSFNSGDLLRLHGGIPPVEGYWLVDSAGVRSVSERDYIRALQRMPQSRPNQAMQTTPKGFASAKHRWTGICLH